MHVVADISGHGYGHLAQAAPVLNHLAGIRPQIRVTVRTTLPDTVLGDMLTFPFERAQPPPDVGLEMRDPITVDRDASAGAYAVIHHDWVQLLSWETEALAKLAPDLLLAAVPYASLPAAKAVGARAVALSSLHWDGIFRAYCGDSFDAPRILDHITAAYAAADVFLQVTPHMPMALMENRRSIGPVARLGRNRKVELVADADRTLVLVTYGGIPGTPAFENLPALEGVTWILPQGRRSERPDTLGADDTGLPFIDLLASADAAVTKLGYGTLVEAACNGTRILYVDRPDWPEAEPIGTWLAENGIAQAMPRSVLERGDLEGPLRALLARPLKPPLPQPTGIEQAANAILDLFSGDKTAN